MKTKKSNTAKKLTKFEALFERAINENSMFGDDEDEVIDDYEGGESSFDDTSEFSDEDVTITLTQNQISVLKEILAQVDGGDEESDEESEDEDIDDIDDIEELEKEAIESEKGVSAETARNHTKSGKAVDNTGDLEKETETEDGEEKQYKFVKRTKPQELKHKTTKGS